MPRRAKPVPNHRRSSTSEFKAWVNKTLPEVVSRLEKSATQSFDVHPEDGLDLAGRQEIYDVLDDLLAALFPGCYSREPVSGRDMNFFLGDILRHVSFRLTRHIREVLRVRCVKDNCKSCDCDNQAERAVMSVIAALPDVRTILLQDIQAAYEGDPAAKSPDEIVMSYPCIEAIATHRVAHELYRLDIPIIPRIMSERAHGRTGIDIHPGATIGPRFFIDHGTGVVIGETTTIGRNVKLYQGVTLGALSFPLDKKGKPVKGTKRHPDIRDNVVIYANATILGGGTVIGKGAVVGGNTWITSSVAPGAVVHGATEQDREHSGRR